MSEKYRGFKSTGYEDSSLSNQATEIKYQGGNFDPNSTVRLSQTVCEEEDCNYSDKLERLLQAFTDILDEEQNLEQHERLIILDLLKNWLTQRTPQSKEDLLYTLGMIDRRKGLQMNQALAAQLTNQSHQSRPNTTRNQSYQRERYHSPPKEDPSSRRRATSKKVRYTTEKIMVKRVKVRPLSVGPHQCHTDIEKRKIESLKHCNCGKECEFHNCEYRCDDCRFDCRHSHCLKIREAQGQDEDNHPLLSKEEMKLWKNKRLLNCHYRGVYNNKMMEELAKRSESVLKEQKLSKKKEIFKKKKRKQKLEDFNKSISLKNKEKYTRHLEPSTIDNTKNRLAWGPDKRVHEAKQVETKTKKDPNKEHKTPEEYLKEYKKKQRLLKRKEEEEKMKENERCDHEHQVCRCKKKRDSKSRDYYNRKKKENLKRYKIEKEKKLLEDKKKKDKLKKVQKKAKKSLKKSIKQTFHGDDRYPFNFTMDPAKNDQENMNIDTYRNEEHKERMNDQNNIKIAQASEDYLQHAPINAQYNSEQPHLGSGNNEIEFAEAPSMTYIQNTKLMTAEREMLKEISSSLKKAVEMEEQSLQVEVRQLDKINDKKTFEEHLMNDPQEAYENKFFGLRPNPNHIDFEEDYEDEFMVSGKRQDGTHLPKGNYFF